jgi:hypothetical protein
VGEGVKLGDWEGDLGGGGGGRGGIKYISVYIYIYTIYQYVYQYIYSISAYPASIGISGQWLEVQLHERNGKIADDRGG